MNKSMLRVVMLAALCGMLRAQDSAAPKAMPASADPGIEVATIKPSNPDRGGELFTIKGRHIVTTNTTLRDIIRFAYGVHPTQIEGTQPWMAADKFDIDAVADVEGQPNNAQMQVMMRKLLQDRFGLIFHREHKELAVYALTVARGGPKLTKTKRTASASTDFLILGDTLIVNNATLQGLVIGLSRGPVNKPVVDRTNLTDRYDFVLRWTPDDSTSTDPTRPPGFYTAFEEQLGLKLQPSRAAVEVLIIDHVERPPTN